MKKTSLNKIVYLILLCALFIKIQSVFAAQTFQNNLLKTDLYKSSLGGVKVTLYTNKPYNDAVVVNKKSDLEYVILLPETSNSLTAKPATTSVSDVIKNVEVKTQQYANQVKGYTKITISTSRPVEITPQIQVLNNSNQLTDKDYRELLAQTAKKNALPNKAVTKPIVKTPVKQLPLAKNETAKTEQKSTTKMPTLILGKAQKKPSLNLPVKPQKQVIKAPVPLQKASQSKIVSEPRVSNKVKPAEQLKPVAVKPPVQQKVVAPVAEKSLPTPNVNQVATTQPEIQPPAQTQMQTPTVAPEVSTPVTPPIVIQPPVQQVGRFHKYKNMIKDNIYSLAGAMLIGFLILLLMIRRINKNPQKQKEIFTSHLNEQPLPVKDYSENISEDMTWKEKFQTYVEASSQPSVEEPTSPVDVIQVPPSASDELDELFSAEVPKRDENIDRGIEQIDLSGSATVQEELFENEPIQEKFVEDELIEEQPFESDTLQYYESPEEEIIGSSQIDDLFGLDDDINEEIVEDSGYEIEPEEDVVVEEPEPEIETEFETDLEALALATSTTKEIPYVEPEVDSELIQQVETVKSEFNIDDDKGFYLIDFEDTTALVGHIEDEIFVLKRFDQKIDAPLQARLDQKNGNSTNYMTKVGSFRGLVEVTPENMNLLIEL